MALSDLQIPNPQNFSGYIVALVVGLSPTLWKAVQGSLRRNQTESGKLMDASGDFRKDVMRVLELERNNTALNSQAQQSVIKHLEERIDNLERKALEGERTRRDMVQREIELQSEVFKLKRQCVANEDTIATLQKRDTENSATIATLQTQNADLSRQIENLQIRLQSREDFDENNKHAQHQ